MKYACLPFLIFAFFILTACSKKTDPLKQNTLFVELSAENSGIDFNNQLTETEEFNIIEYLYFYNGGGVAVGDINNDGLLDLYFSANQLPNKLYLNKGNMVFEDITDRSGIGSFGPWKTGISMADINGDGLLDIYVCRLGDWKGIKGKNELYINNGDLTFTESAELYGLDFQGFSTQATFFDYDKDGDLDMYLLNHAVHTENSYGRSSLRFMDSGPAGDRLYRNNAEKGEKRFTPVTNEAGIFSSQIGYGLGIGIADVNNDSWPDIYVSNDFNENDYLYINQGNGTFKESSKDALTYMSRFSMGNDLADFNNDGWIDIMSLDMLPQDEIVQKMSAGEDSYEIYQLKLNFGYGRQTTRNSLQLNNANGTFSEIGQLAGVNATDWSWSPLFADFDNDGWKDLFISNGIARRPNDMDYINFITNPEEKGGLVQKPDISDLNLAGQMPPGEVPNYFFKNSGNLTFENVSEAWGISEATISNGAVYADLDNDGDLDLVVNHINKISSVFENSLNQSGETETQSFLKIRFEGLGNNKFGIGVRVEAYMNGVKIIQENFTSRGFQSSVAPEINLGLGKTVFIDSLKIIWPTEKSETLLNLEVNRILTVKEENAIPISIPEKETKQPLLKKLSTEETGLEFLHIEDDYNDFNKEPLLPHKLSQEGPAFTIGDSNGDGLEDIFIGGAKGQESRLFIQNKNGKFLQSEQEILKKDLESEETYAAFLQRESKDNADLLLLNGGNNPSSTHSNKILLHQNQSSYSSSLDLPIDPESQYSVAISHDIDGDGLEDLFVGGRNVIGKYGQLPISYILKNSGNGTYADITPQIAPDLTAIGMVKSAAWVDLDLDGKMDLVVVGEWMPITILMHRDGRLINETNKFGLANTSGWWNTVEIGDLNGDGFPDLVLGNLGLNSRLKTSEEAPVRMYVKDFDGNGSLEQILTYHKDGKEYTIATRDELVKQIPLLKKDFVRHSDFAGKTVDEIFKNFKLADAKLFEAKKFESVILFNNVGKGFTIQPLPTEAQFAPIQVILMEDLDGDGILDMLLGGNMTAVSPYFGAYQGSHGLALKGNGKGGFSIMENGKLGIQGDIKHIKSIKVKNERWILFVKNDGEFEVFSIKP
ncbi:VCBS repeat-containing protein [Aquiflexum gelatinilyticum]|uniref:VCBS repeat-containing protein n=1 Tax=Aquiflexum gelatinilyticum TaxID=2961943 RepID=A0A9X2T287_9BACT|nr:VCBS repeat-containing protein [Aquiflexum gelatinilyticum]MCR9015200.1 VCBS repeat-containing protein [Aquiflexum gelatinilyticum]